MNKRKLAEIIQWIRELKHLRSQSGQPNWTIVEMRKLLDLKAQATFICVGFAHARGRLHMKVWGNLRIDGLEEQAAVLEAFSKRYGQDRSPTPANSASIAPMVERLG